MAQPVAGQTAIAVYGAGGFGREVAQLLETCMRYERLGSSLPSPRMIGFLDDNATGTVRGYPVMRFEDACARHPDLHVALGIGSSRSRRRVAEKILAAGGQLLTLIHPSVEIDPSNQIGKGVIICGGTTITVDARIEDGVQINLHCTIGHDAVLSPYSTLAPGVHISGFVNVGPDVTIGTGAQVINGTPDKPLVVGRGAVVGAGACVYRDIPADVTVGGVPARPLVPKSS
jgi:sugar O-acyltransferase (sialic acid O-acetyltransferase NeuD family)